jgi:hypothetical protein
VLISHGITGRNIPSDLQLEICKETVTKLGSMKKNEGLICSSKCVGELDKVITILDKELRVS